MASFHAVLVSENEASVARYTAYAAYVSSWSIVHSL